MNAIAARETYRSSDVVTAPAPRAAKQAVKPTELLRVGTVLYASEQFSPAAELRATGSLRLASLLFYRNGFGAATVLSAITSMGLAFSAVPYQLGLSIMFPLMGSWFVLALKVAEAQRSVGGRKA